jgi:hypothetical protein
MGSVKSVSCNLSKVLARHGGDGRVEASTSCAGQVSRDLVYFLRIGLLIFEMGEVEASHAVCLQLNEAWSYNCTVEVDSLVVGGRCTIHNSTCIIRHHQVSLDQLAGYA